MVGNLPAATKCVSRGCLLLALSSALFSAPAWPQTQLATVFGTITDTSGAVISGAQVTILNLSTGLKRDTFTELTGQYRIVGLPPGNYSVRVEKEGFQTQVREGISLTSASEIMINLSLSVGDLKQQVTVTIGLSYDRQYHLHCQWTCSRAKPNRTSLEWSRSVYCGDLGTRSHSNTQQCSVTAFRGQGGASGD